MTPIRRALGERFDDLPAEVASLHAAPGTWHGEITVEGPAPRILTLLVRLSGLPKATGGPVPLRFTTSPDTPSLWTREIDGRPFRSTLSCAEPGRLSERIGLTRAITAPDLTGDHLHLRLVRFAVAGIPLPRRLWPDVSTTEWGEAGRYRFDIEVRAPLTGWRLVRYSGWLDPT